jgi:hypothetical protein
VAAAGAGVERRYNVAFEIFRWWLCRNGRAQLLLPNRERAPSSVVPTAVPSEPSGSAPLVLSAEFPLTDDQLLPIAEGLYYRGKQVDAMRIKQWLRQFEDDARMVLAFKLLSALRQRWYYDDAKVSLALDKAFNRGLALAKDAGVIPMGVSASRRSGELMHFKAEHLRRDSFRGVIANVFVSYFGDALKSGAEVARMLKKDKRTSAAGSLERAADWLDRPGDMEPTKRFVLVVDDFVGSGQQAIKEMRGLLKKWQERPQVQQALEQGRIVYVPLWAFRVGVDELREQVPSLRVEPVALLDECDQAFAVEAEIFDSEDERKIAEGFCRHVGGQLYQEYPLGWENLQAMVVLPDAVPNATLPIFWCSGMVDERQWKPLFAR